MTDHPSNPPSQEPPADEYCLRAQVISYNCKHTGRGEMGCISCFAREFQRLDSALAAQEARHKAALDAQWATAQERVGKLVDRAEEAESKLRQAQQAAETPHECEATRRVATLRDSVGRLWEQARAIDRTLDFEPDPPAVSQDVQWEPCPNCGANELGVCDPPEQETPKPEPSMRHARSAANPDYPYERVCVGCGEDWPCASAPPAHGGGE